MNYFPLTQSLEILAKNVSLVDQMFNSYPLNYARDIQRLLEYTYVNRRLIQ